MTASRNHPRMGRQAQAKKSAAPQDAVTLLHADHDAVRQLFDEYAHTRSVANKTALLDEICTALSVHMQIKEEMFYPDVRAELKNKHLVREATVQHGGVKALIAQLRHAQADTEIVDAKVKMMSAYVRHHVKEEQDEMFPQVKASSLDIVELGARMAARRDDLLSRIT